jgi:hypothetical protein
LFELLFPSCKSTIKHKKINMRTALKSETATGSTQMKATCITKMQNKNGYKVRILGST